MKYTKVPLVNISDDESDEDEIFNQANSQQFGDLELKLIPSATKVVTKTKVRSPKVVTTYSWYKKLCLMGTFIAFILGIALIIIIKIKFSSGSEKIYYKQTPSWKHVLADAGSESCIHLMDVDDDGRDDVLFGAASSVDLNNVVDLSYDLKKYCKMKGQSYPCIGGLKALRGYDGKLLWSTPTVSGILFMNCEDFDVNKDGKKDCIVTGRQGMAQAIDVTNNGSTLWMGDTKHIMPAWNTYQAFALPDFDNDGVPEVLISHGGDPKRSPDEHNRKSGRLIMLSGATGKTFGERHLDMPESKETYMSPVIYTCKDGSQYIFFGSGGETVPGDLMIISVPDFYRYVTHKGPNAKVPSVHGKYDHWTKRGRDPKGILTLYKGVYKGVMVPPLFIDVDKDGVNDIVLSAYDGRLLLFNGADLKIVWMAEFLKMESYSTPAPGYFNDDDTIDFMFHWSTGRWPYYNQSVAYVIDGKNGKFLWTLNSSMYEMSSILVLKTNQQYRDIYLFRVKGRGSTVYRDMNGVLHGVGVQRKIDNRHGSAESSQHKEDHKRHGSPESSRHEEDQSKDIEDYRKEYAEHHYVCTEDTNIKAETFLMDRTLMKQPIKTLEYGAEKFNYVPLAQYDEGTPSNKTMCIIALPIDRTTGAIGDVDGDGTVDVVLMTEIAGELVDRQYSYDKMKYKLYIDKINIEPLLKNKTLRTKVDASVKMDTNKKESDIANISILPPEKQTWTEYLGKFHRSLFVDT